MERYSIDVVENATKVANIMPETSHEKVVADCMKDYLEYRKAEEQGLLLRLPLKLGDKVYSSVHFRDITEFEINRVTYVHSAGDLYLEYDAKTTRGGKKYAISITGHMLGKTIFLTKAEAEKALEEMEERR